MVGLLTKILTIVTSLLATVGMLQADVNALKAGQPSGEFGAVPVLSSPLTVNGVKNYFDRQTMKTATTTVCAIKSPAATSTLVSGLVNFSVSSTTASTVTVAKSATAYATTTLINSVSVGANAYATILTASTTNSALVQTDRTFAPNTYLVVGMAGGVGTFSPTGYCSAQWQTAY